MKFSKRLERFPDEIFASLNKKKLEMEKEGRKIYNLSVGTPDFETAPHIKNARIEAAKEQDNWKYSLRDTPEMLEAVCSYYKKRFDVDITPDMVCSCNGSQEGIGHIGLVLCDEGDTVLLPSPCYPVFIASANMAGAKPFYYPMTDEAGYLPRLSDIPEEVARQAVYMIVSLPSNPTGSVAKEGIYEEIITFAKKYDILIIHDNAYSDIIFDGEVGGSFLKHPGAKDVGVEFFSLSKSFNMTGARVSFCIGRKDVIAAFRKLREQIDFGMFYPIQKAAVAALTGPLDMVRKQCTDYEARRNELCGGLRKIGWDLPDSHGSMFVWAPVPKGFGDSFSFCMELMERTGVICTPGASFGPLGEGYIRMALVLEPEEIRKAVEAIDESGILR